MSMQVPSPGDGDKIPRTTAPVLVAGVSILTVLGLAITLGIVIVRLCVWHREAIQRAPELENPFDRELSSTCGSVVPAPVLSGVSIVHPDGSTDVCWPAKAT